MLLIMMLMIIMLLIMILWITMLLIRNWKTDSALEEQKLRRVSPRGLELLLRRWSRNSIIIIIIVIIIITAIVIIIIIVTLLFDVFVVILNHSLLFSIVLISGVNKKLFDCENHHRQFQNREWPFDCFSHLIDSFKRL